MQGRYDIQTLPWVLSGCLVLFFRGIPIPHKFVRFLAGRFALASPTVSLPTCAEAGRNYRANFLPTSEGGRKWSSEEASEWVRVLPGTARYSLGALFFVLFTGGAEKVEPPCAACDLYQASVVWVTWFLSNVFGQASVHVYNFANFKILHNCRWYSFEHSSKKGNILGCLSVL